jgi:tetratricopeptide (TPR) repeat protein
LALDALSLKPDSADAATLVTRVQTIERSDWQRVTWRIMGEIFTALEDDPARAIATASAIADAAVKLDRTHERLMGSLASLRTAQGRWREAGQLRREIGNVGLTNTLPLHSRARADIPTDRGWFTAAAYAAAEQGDEVLVDSLTWMRSIPPERVKALQQGLRGLAALRRGETARALVLLRQALDFAGIGDESNQIDAMWARFALEAGRLELASGDYDAASRRIAAKFMGNAGFVELAICYAAEFQELRALVAQARGDTSEARAAWQQVIAIWRDADSVVQPRVVAARAALAQLH